MATILIVDDSAVNRDYLASLLGYIGHRPIVAANALDALASAQSEHPDLVIADLVMPEIDGFEFVRRLREKPEIAATRVIFYSATYLEGEARALALSCGVSHILVKPAEPQTLLATVNSALAIEQPEPAPLRSEQFDREHSRLLLNKLNEKVDELEVVNAELEQRVAARTAELAAANQQLQQLNYLKDEVLVIASHDMRSPLTAILLMAESLLEEGDSFSSQEQKYFLENIVAASHRLMNLVNNLLDLTKIESGYLELERTELQISELARRVVEAMSFNARAKSIDMQLVVAPDEPFIYADRFQLSQVLHNLINNAIKFTPQGGSVTVRIRPEQQGVVVEVADNGIGITADSIQHIFKKFQRAHLQGTAGEKGTGLGLAIVQQLVQLHGGSITVSSEINRGSTFTVYLPRS